MDSLEQNRKHKELIKLERLKINKEKVLKSIEEKRIKFWDTKYNEISDKLKDKYERRKQRDIERRKKRTQERYEKAIKNQTRIVIWKPEKEYKKKHRTLARYKRHAITDYQRCVRFEAQDDRWYVFCIDNPSLYRKRNAVDAWHIFPKSLYPHLIFHPHNCFPQSKQSNKVLWQNVARWFKDEVVKRIGDDAWSELVKLVEDKQEKNKFLDKRYRIEKCEFWKNKRMLLENKNKNETTNG